MYTKPIAKTDYTYCVNKQCNQKDICARYFNNYIMKEDELYSFCNFNHKTCIESEENNESTRITKTNNE